MNQTEHYEKIAQEVAGKSIFARGLPSIGGNSIAAQQAPQPRKYIGEQIAQATHALSQLFEEVQLLEQRLSSVTEAPYNATGCSPQPKSSEPPFVEAMDSIVEKIHVARQMVSSLTERVRV